MKLPETRFNIKDSIFYMDRGIPNKGVIEGISVFIGNKRYGNGSGWSAPKPLIEYHIEGACLDFVESMVYATKEEMIKEIFDKL